jgi:hypothetical protein
MVNTTIIPSKLIAEAKVFNGEITNEMVFIAYEPTWVFDVPIYKDLDKYIIGKFGDLPSRSTMDLYIFAIFKTMEKCVNCMEKCGYTIKPFLSSDETCEDKDIEFMDEVSKLKVFEFRVSPSLLISKMSLTDYKPILKAGCFGNDEFHQFGNLRFTDPTTTLNKYQQNYKEDFNSDENYPSFTMHTSCPSLSYRVVTSNNVMIALALMSVGDYTFDDYIFRVDRKVIKDIMERYDTPQNLLTYLQDRFNIKK